MIVVDLGCHTHGTQDSVQHLIERFTPELLFGFDPHPQLVERVERIGETTAVFACRAAWTTNATRSLRVDGSRTRLAGDGADVAQTFDLAWWLFTLPHTEIVVKMDVEGAEAELFHHLRHRQADLLLQRVLVEWHGAQPEMQLACPVEEWSL